MSRLLCVVWHLENPSSPTSTGEIFSGWFPCHCYGVVLPYYYPLHLLQYCKTSKLLPTATRLQEVSKRNWTFNTAAAAVVQCILLPYQSNLSNDIVQSWDGIRVTIHTNKKSRLSPLAAGKDEVRSGEERRTRPLRETARRPSLLLMEVVEKLMVVVRAHSSEYDASVLFFLMMIYSAHGIISDFTIAICIRSHAIHYKTTAGHTTSWLGHPVGVESRMYSTLPVAS